MRARRGSPEWKARVAEGRRRAAEAARRKRAYHLSRLRVAPADLLAIETGDFQAVRPELLPLVSAASDEAFALLEAQGGADRVSAQRLLAAQDFGRLGAVLRGLLLRWAQTADPELASRVASVATARRSLLAMLGLDERREEKSLDEYVRARSAAQAPAGATIDATPARDPAPDARAAPSANAPHASATRDATDPANPSLGPIDAADTAAEGTKP